MLSWCCGCSSGDLFLADNCFYHHHYNWDDGEKEENVFRYLDMSNPISYLQIQKMQKVTKVGVDISILQLYPKPPAIVIQRAI